MAASGRDPDEEDEYRIIDEIRRKKSMLEGEQARLRSLFERMDNLYYPDAIQAEGGADHWPEGAKAGRVHVSVNTPPVYVDVPASLQAVTPVMNYIAKSSSPEDREQAARAERLMFEWFDEDEFELKNHKACVIKGLYGFTYGKVMWDAQEKRPTVTVIEAPENLYVGWGNSDYSRIDWTIYCYGLSPAAITEDYGLGVVPVEVDGSFVPYVTTGDHLDPIGNVYGSQIEHGRSKTAYEQMQVEVYDYWYKRPIRKGKSEIWNAIYVGNRVVKNKKHPEYDDIPYLPLPNTFIPKSPYGRPELYDLEQLFRETDERTTNAGQMIQSIIGGQMWQLVGAEAPDEVPENAMPKPNAVAAPGPGNELRALQPFMPQFAIEDYIKRIDLEKEVGSGLNELLLGRAPATILGSSKAIAALVANYEARIRMKRDLLYQWRKRVWKMAAKVWSAKSADVRDIIDGQYRIEIKAPELTPRDELENAQKAINLVQNRIWSAKRAMDATGVEDPEDETGLIREEQTDPAQNPQAVLQQMTILGTATQLGMAPPQTTVDQSQNAVRQLQRPAGGTSSLNGPENRANPPGEALPSNAQAPNGAPAAGGGSAVLQTLVNGQGAQGRILTQTPLGGG
ncbi:MAG: hypothetical protein EPN91_03365 [Salinibacterium sp.]|nr:MAG: hypothetical protein EPN91_03365 [Salinibacterium sp.]